MKYGLRDLTLEEKMKLLCGRDWWHLYTADGKLPEVTLTDGPSGIRRANYEMENGKIIKRTFSNATAMPTISVLSNTWNKELAFLDGETIADECVEYERDVLLAPGVNIKRTPLCGRNFEYFSEDPYLAGTMAAAYIEGVQSKGIGTCLKHYCANNREYDRSFQSSEVDERTLREIYLAPFELALKAKPWSVMCSYNPINGVYGSENSYLLNDVLRDEFGFDGIVISDWYAVHQSARTHKAGLDLEMPYRNKAYDELREGYEKGYITEEEIDVLVERILKFIEKIDDARKTNKYTMSHEERHNNARKIAEEGIVLLKNEDGILPLKGGKIHVSGPGAKKPPFGGGGSSEVTTEYEPMHLGEEIKNRLGDSATILLDNSLVRYREKVNAANRIPYTAYDADTVILCFGTDSSIEFEDGDRTSIRLPRVMENVILDTAKVNENIVVVLHSGSAVDVSPWIDKVKGLLYIGYGGEGIQEATADILCGIVSPSGKLSETFPLCLEDTPTGSYRGDGFVDRYTEGILVGYRYYDYYDKDVMFPFGHGLSYATLEYGNMDIEKHSELEYTVSLDVKNISDIPAKETVQLYVRDVFSCASRPKKELKGYEKISLAPGETKRVSIELDSRSFAYYNTSLHRWYVENGAFEILIGASSRDIRLKKRLDIELPFEEQMTFVVHPATI